MPRRHRQATVRCARRAIVLAGVLVVGGCVGRETETIRARDVTEAARELERNVHAINQHDIEAYLAQYLESPDLIVASADSLRRGYLMFAEARRSSDDWPDTLLIGEPVLVWIAPGVVWAAFEYRAVIGPDTARGMSERLFVKTPAGWRIAVTGMMEQ